MFSRTLVGRFDSRRLRWLLIALFTALALPTALLVWQAWGQLKWEAFHQYRGSAEELTGRVDARIAGLVASAERRSFAEYSFLLEPGPATSNVVQRSPLSSYPVETGLPGLIGYFQIDSSGRFSTPLLPAAGTLGAEFGIGAAEYAERLTLAENIRSVLADNRLVQPRSPHEEDKEQEAAFAAGPAEPAATRELRARQEYSQQVFDELGSRKRQAPAAASAPRRTASEYGAKDAALSSQQLNTIGKVSDIPLDASLQEVSEKAERDVVAGAERADADDAPIRTFASEVDAYEFSLLDSGHLVLFRNVWRGGERYVQGLLIDGQRFVAEGIGVSFTSSGLADRSSLIVAYDDDVIATFANESARPDHASAPEDLGGSLLYRSRFSAPFDRLELIYSVQELPLGPSGRVLIWLSLVLALVFIGGFTILNRLGAGQIRLARQQQDFVSAVSHELKTPLTSIRMYGEMLKQGWADESKRQVYYEFIHDEAERLSRLIANVLQLASITRNEPQLNLQPIAVRELLDNVESRISSLVERAGFELRVRQAEVADSTVVRVDADCFLQILINLVDNALKFSRNSDTKIVEIECRTIDDTYLRFSVRDYGPGIPKDQMKKIFQLFYRSESELTRETVGTGIGLAIVHQLTTAMHGTVDLVNAEPGAEFRLVFPVDNSRQSIAQIQPRSR